MNNNGFEILEHSIKEECGVWIPSNGWNFDLVEHHIELSNWSQRFQGFEVSRQIAKIDVARAELFIGFPEQVETSRKVSVGIEHLSERRNCCSGLETACKEFTAWPLCGDRRDKQNSAILWIG